MIVRIFPIASRKVACCLALVCAIAPLACSTAEVNGMQIGPGASCGGATNPRNPKLDKIDLLFVVDNSASMADKQAILADAVPDLVDRLTNPVCVNLATGQWDGTAVAPGEPCPDNTQREFDPLKDIHIGVITSSLGGHGADSCSESGNLEFNPRQADMSHLITRGKNPGESTFHDVQTWQSKGFLNWDQAQKDSPVGDNNVDTLVQKFSEIVRGAGEDGCGFESTLEAWYRFLVDPEPYEKMIPCPCYDGDAEQRCRCPDGLDRLVLQQRADMIRQDSLLVVVMLSDENDCSVMDGGQNYLALQALDGSQPFHVKRGTNGCQSDPWSADCKSCWQVDESAYPECQSGWSNPEQDDPLNLRCFDQKRRFGLDFLQPVKRYVDALTQRRFADNTVNPVFCSQYATKPDPNDPSAQIIDRETCLGTWPMRDASLVFLAGIVGVPWQDIARDPNDLSKGYRKAWELKEPVSKLDSPPAGVPQDKTLWDVILGETRYSDGEIVPTVAPLDPLMKESVDPRTGTNPITGDALASTASGPLNNKLNGSEWDITSRADLQYACIFDLPTPLPNGSDCAASPENPLCYDNSTQTFGTTQYRAKAYPSRRQLAVLKGVGDQAVVASICPAKADPSTKADADWGYRPAIASIVDRLKSSLQRSCWDVPLPVDADGRVPCAVLEATKSYEVDASGNVVCPPCEGARVPPDAHLAACVAADSDFVENGLSCLCELQQLSDPDQLRSCLQDDIVDSSAAGWCYLDENSPKTNRDLLASCPADQKRLIRFVGQDVPRTGSLTFLRCTGAALGSE